MSPRTDGRTRPSPGGVEHDLSETWEPVWSIPSLREPRYSQSLERGLAILGCFTPKRPVLGIADIADELTDGLQAPVRRVGTRKCST